MMENGDQSSVSPVPPLAWLKRRREAGGMLAYFAARVGDFLSFRLDSVPAGGGACMKHRGTNNRAQMS